MAHAPHSFRAINVFIQHMRYEIVFVLRREFVAMCSGAQKITGVLWFGEQLPQNMTRVGRDGPKESLVCIDGQLSNGLSISREEPSSAAPPDKSFQSLSCAVVKPHQAGDAYSMEARVVMRATSCTWVGPRPCDRSIRRACMEKAP